jgi:hypothetical protein
LTFHIGIDVNNELQVKEIDGELANASITYDYSKQDK